MREDLVRATEEFKTRISKGDAKKIEEIIEPTETILFATPTNCTIAAVNTKNVQRLPGIAVLTNKRFVFSYKILLSSALETIPVSEIQSVNCSGNGLTGGHVQIHTIVKTYDILVSYKKEAMQKIEKAFETARNNSVTSVAANSNDDVFAQIEKLSSLHEKGILSDEEFQAKKQELLAKI
ncbi:MAG TPA: hypothetical protein DER68_01545 [Ruminococcaceae bacterium]|nr:hypothetical protein [Oscillospiraceae bacterium]